ncbi:AIPR family protein [Funiculus sociatus GB2-A5]|uniref:AIPR family protein n=1 Tax=Funiculus sociatus GB2-A5 TaxID=2933946 RepID=A0ABV0JNL5_9CYAN|nr:MULTISPECIES: AIPR family protein [unclassified Trichocoleus]MBD1908591.1 AIPR family protein [Trichocoleus sp. FACHB-832]MBD2063923.1 AIPR family protein [Trichocoleus sp. FACHB-6]
MQVLDLSLLAKTACRGYTAEETAIWNLTVPVTELPQGLPFGPNARNASLDAKPAKAMLKTLAEEPEKFILYNSGIMIVAAEIVASRVEGGDFKVRLKLQVPSTEDEGDFLGHGVLNGGHTYKALMHALHGKRKRGESYSNLSSAYVQVSVAVGISEHEIASISRARNLSLSVPLYALKNLAQDWKPIEEALPKEYRQHVLFKPNEYGEFEGNAHYNVTDLIRRLALLNNKLFDFRQDKHPIKAYSSSGSLVQGWKEEDYKQVIPLLQDILWLEQKIMEQHVEINGTGATGKKVVIPKVSGCSAKPMKLITGKEISLTIGDIFYMPILAAFRVLIKDGQWTKPVETLWEEWGTKLVDKLWDTYKSEGRSSASAFASSKSTWSTLTNLVAMQFVQI